MGKKLTTEQFIERARAVHGDKYDYSKVNYVNNSTKVTIICPKHGEFEQIPNSHLLGKGCRECGYEQISYGTVVKKIHEIYGYKYDLSLFTEYTNSKKPITIICPKHGPFKTTVNRFVSGKHGCKKCATEIDNERKKLGKDEILKRFKKIHHDKYVYDTDFEYQNVEDKIKIYCPKHGYFYQSIHCHLKGRGCPSCNQSHLENNIEQFLTEKGINFTKRAHFPWLGGQHLDFYLTDYNVGIECQGEQHFVPVEFFGGEEGLKSTMERDERKSKLCNDKGVELLYFTYYEGIKEEGNIYKNKDKLLEKIMSTKCL